MHKVYVDAEMLFYAFRYALGRRSYAPSWVVDNILANVKEIPIEMHKQFISEIEEAGINADDSVDCDWHALKYRLAKEIECRVTAVPLNPHA